MERKPSLRVRRLKLASLCQQANDIAPTTLGPIAKELLVRLEDEFDQYQQGIERECESEQSAAAAEADFKERLEAFTVAQNRLIAIASANSKTSVESSTDLAKVLEQQTQLMTTLTCRPSVRANNSRLPKLTIPVFSGKVEDWLSFRDLFTSAIDDDEDLSDAQKLQHLKTLVSGEAAALIRSIAVTDSNYAIAYKTLEEHYHRPFLILKLLIDRITRCEMVSSDSENLSKLTSLFFDTIKSIDSLGKYAKSRDPWVITLLLSKLNPELKKRWVQENSDANEPNVDDFLKFLSDQASMIRLAGPEPNSKRERPSSTVRVNTVVGGHKCFFCQGEHIISHCSRFQGLPYSEREQSVRSLGRCLNCLGKGHFLKNCTSTRTCAHCKKRHHTTLHPDTIERDSSECETKDERIPNFEHVATSCVDGGCSLLPTAIVMISSGSGSELSSRILLDSGSQINLISEKLVHRLGLKRQSHRLPIKRVSDDGTVRSRGKVTVRLRSCIDHREVLHVTAFVVPSVIKRYPCQEVAVPHMSEVKREFTLADKGFNLPSEIDLLLNAATTFESFKRSRLKHKSSRMFLQDTIFGFVVVCGDREEHTPASASAVAISPTDDGSTNAIIERFWRVEDLPASPQRSSPEEEQCEEFFKSTMNRLQCGRFSVRLPFREFTTFGDTYRAALRQFFNLERRLSASPDLRHAYHSFMNEYARLGHMSVLDVSQALLPKGKHFFIPHHAIWQQSIQGSKLRVVFNASAKCSDGKSLNDFLLKGRALQTDITAVISRFRRYRFVMSADISKMYRGILVHEEDRMFQLILWRGDREKPVAMYQLNTVTYGVKSSPFLALRVILEILERDSSISEDARDALTNGRYVDDLFFGGETIEHVTNLRKEISQVLASAGFHLHKWIANEPALMMLQSVESWANPCIFGEDDTLALKTLGVSWNPVTDSFTYLFRAIHSQSNTKRALLMQSARLYDPMGWIAPVTVSLKCLFQETWISQLGWDDVLPDSIASQWAKIRDQLSSLQDIVLPRWLGGSSLELHGFSDASKKAYAACIYSRRVDGENVYVRLLIAKTKVAPIRQVSIPRLELCAAHLLAKLVNTVLDHHGLTPHKIVMWTDSSTVLAWLRSLPRQWSTFVGNRISHIHELCPNAEWHHVQSQNNPADIPSRGCTPFELIKNDLWWRGPRFLNQPQFEISKSPLETTVEEAVTTVATTITSNNFFVSLIDRFSTYSRLIRSMAYVFRAQAAFANKGHIPRQTESDLSIKEIKRSVKFLVAELQKFQFSSEWNCLVAEKPIPRSSCIRALNPYHSDGLIRVGGRLRQVHIEGFNSNPIVLKHGHFADLLIRDTHLKSFHGGLQLVCSRIRETYWITRLGQSARRIIGACPRCSRFQARTCTPLMGELPTFRVTPSKPFHTTGVDFAGPFLLRPFRSRGNTTVKGYLAIFVCASTKAVHLEVVMNLSVDALIMSLKRFVARRGQCSTMWSDNGRNFVACGRIFREIAASVRAAVMSSELKSFLTSNLIDWRYIPPYSPNFGGLWEAGVRSVKRHLYRTFSSKVFTIEEFSTVICQVESILNSRPIAPFLAGSDQQLITPNLLLTGQNTNDLSFVDDEQNLFCAPEERMNHRASLIGRFWRQWRLDYLNTVMKRQKWEREEPNLKIGDLVVVKRQSDPPQFWVLGRVEAFSPGLDGVVRVVTIRTQSGTRIESVRNLIKLKVEGTPSTRGSMS